MTNQYPMLPRLIVVAALLALIGCGDRKAATQDGQPATSHPEPAASTASSPAQVIIRYYEAINARDYDSAYALWGQSGKASGQSRSEFAAGFGQTANVSVTVGDSVRIEGAAGSQYATVPVVVDAVLRDGAKQHFEGNYIVRRSMVDGATAEQRRWRIYSASLSDRPSRTLPPSVN
jgi:hypothetical protein